MTTYTGRAVYIRFFSVLAIAICAGYLLGYPLLGLSIVLILYLLWNMAQLIRLLCWLEKAATKAIEPPESKGLWGRIFDGIYRIQRNQTGSRDKLKGVIERIQESTAALDDGIVMVDPLGNLEWWNRAAEEFLGLQAPDDQGQLMTNLVRDPAFSTYFEKGEHKGFIELLSPVNSDRQLQISTTIFGAGNRLLLIRDITRISLLETMRKDFVANVSHELRTPLTVISGYLETLSDTVELHSAIPPMWVTALQRMQQQALRMQNLVADLLLLSRLESVEVNASEDIDIKSLLAVITADAKALSGENQHNVTLSCPDKLYIKGSQNELRSAFSNLAFNAIRYTPAGGNVHINVKMTKRGGKVSVEDNGVGIDPVHIPRLTERFYRIDKGRSLSTGGTGLGLAIVKHVLLRHDASMKISSHPGKGSKFSCCFPKERWTAQSEGTESF